MNALQTDEVKSDMLKNLAWVETNKKKEMYV